jgi:hypothetical protein
MSAPGVSTELAPYEAILAHTELELELAGNGDVEGLAELTAGWEQLTAGLPAVAPPGAAPLLERAQLICERARIDLLRLRESLLGEHADARRAGRAAAGYGRELRGRHRLDRSA